MPAVNRRVKSSLKKATSQISGFAAGQGGGDGGLGGTIPRRCRTTWRARETASRFLVGQVMKITKGSGQPGIGEPAGPRRIGGSPEPSPDELMAMEIGDSGCAGPGVVVRSRAKVVESILNVIQIFMSVVIVLVILAQVRESGGLFGGGQSSGRTRRGLEKTLFQFTIAIGGGVPSRVYNQRAGGVTGPFLERGGPPGGCLPDRPS